LLRSAASFVDLAVAIVVFAVADLGASEIGGLAQQHAFTTTHRALLAGAVGFRQHTRLVEVGVGFVDATVAIVVFAVADFAAGETFFLAWAPLAVLTELITCSTGAEISALVGSVVTSAAIACFATTQPRRIDDTIAIVVFAVAAFFGGLVIVVVCVVSG